MTRPFDFRDWYWIVTGGEPGVYSSAVGDYVPLADATYQAFLADGNAPISGATPGTLREGLAAFGLRYQGQSFPAEESARPRVPRAHARLTAAQDTIPQGSPLAIEWTGGQDPLGMVQANQTQIVIPAFEDGWYAFTVGARFLEAGGGANSGYRALGIFRGPGGSPEDLGTMRIAPSPSLDTSFNFTEYALLSAGDLLRVFAQTGAAGAIDVVARITLGRVE